MLSRFASMIPVPWEHDFGIDFYCLPRVSSGHTEAPVSFCAIQVKGESDSKLTFGGFRDGKPNWRKYELDWLKQLRYPLYLAVVSNTFDRLDLYSITRVLQIFWKTSFPFSISCELQPPAFDADVSTAEPQAAPAEPPVSHGDGNAWSASLGAPLLTLRFTDLVDEASRERLGAVLLAWIAIDNYSLECFFAGVPVVRIPQSYRTNALPHSMQHLMFSHPGNPARAREIADRLSPGIASIVYQLVSQGRTTEARSWIGALEWCDREGVLGRLGKGLLSDLNK